MTQRLTGLDALFVYGEASGWPLHMTALTLFDPSTTPEGLDLDRVRELFRQRLPHLGVLRHRLVRTPGGLDRPVWVEDPDLDVDTHIHAVRVPSPGTPRQVAELVADLTTPPLDPNRPLWEKWVIEGIQGGLVGVLDRVHHSMIDGVRGMQVQAATYDIDPGAPLAREGSQAGTGARVPPVYELIGGAAARLATTPLRALTTAGHAAFAAGRVANVVRRGEAAGFAMPFSAPRTSLNAPISKRRGIAYCSVPLPELHELARREHVSVNDIVLTLVGGALRAYLLERDELPRRSLTAGLPVGVASRGETAAVGGNRLTLTTASLATSIADPLERLHAVARSTQAGKLVIQAIGPELMMELAELAPPTVVGASARGYARLRLVDRHPPIVNVIVSNLRGAPMPLYLAGAQLVAAYPIGPLGDGLGPNITVIGYQDSLDFGLNLCPDVVDDPWRLVDGLRATAAELTGRKRGSRRRPRPPRGAAAASKGRPARARRASTKS
jgi:diacylglycerol O-acyltransferase / wax synthase